MYKRKIVLGILRFASMLLEIFEEGISENFSKGFWYLEVHFFNYIKSLSAQSIPKYFEICKFAFINICIGEKQNFVLGILRFASILF